MALSSELRRMLEDQLDPAQLAALDRDPNARTGGARPSARPKPWKPMPENLAAEARKSGYKQCNCCGQVLQVGTSEHPASYGDFGMDNAMKDGRKGSCRECCTQQSRESTARTRGKEFICSSTNEMILAVFPSFPADPERAAAWAAAHPEATESGTTGVADRPARSRRNTQANVPPDTSELVEMPESGILEV